MKYMGFATNVAHGYRKIKSIKTYGIDLLNIIMWHVTGVQYNVLWTSDRENVHVETCSLMYILLLTVRLTAQFKSCLFWTVFVILRLIKLKMNELKRFWLQNLTYSLRANAECRSQHYLIHRQQKHIRSRPLTYLKIKHVLLPRSTHRTGTLLMTYCFLYRGRKSSSRLKMALILYDNVKLLHLKSFVSII